MKVEDFDVDYYENHDFGPEMKKAREEGRSFDVSGCTLENALDNIRKHFGVLKEPESEYKP